MAVDVIQLKKIVEKDPDYLMWILSQDFSDEVKVMIEQALKGNYPKPQSE